MPMSDRNVRRDAAPEEAVEVTGLDVMAELFREENYWTGRPGGLSDFSGSVRSIRCDIRDRQVERTSANRNRLLFIQATVKKDVELIAGQVGKQPPQRVQQMTNLPHNVFARLWNEENEHQKRDLGAARN